jgi:hypothetical protein
MGLAGPNCWVPMLAKLVDALAASATFWAMVGLDGTASDAEVRGFIFGNRVTHSKDGHVWTRDELLTLRHFAAVFDDPEQPYGKHVKAGTNTCYIPHGVSVVSLHRLIVDAELVADLDGRFHTTDQHDEDWRTIIGDTLSEILDYLIENGGPIAQAVEVEGVTTTPPRKGATQGMWQGCEIVFPWRED